MRTFDYKALQPGDCSDATFMLLEHIEDCKRSFIELAKKPIPALAPMKRQAAFDNVDASARIEGINVMESRERGLIDGKIEPISETEQQLAGYARILRAIAKSPEFFTISTSTLLAMHTVLFTGRIFDNRGRYRSKDYLDIVDAAGQVKRIPASPINAFETPLYLGSLCDSLADAFPKAESPLLIIPRVMLDFQCIRPFGEGNGRLARLFAALLLRMSNYSVSDYVSIDRLCMEDAMAYYDALNAGLDGWEDNAGDYEPFTNYWLGKVLMAYRLLLAQIEIEQQKPLSKMDRVRYYCESQTGRITKRAIIDANPDISVSTIENALHDLVEEGILVMTGSGRGAAYERAKWL